jgi:hypothetical protein
MTNLIQKHPTQPKTGQKTSYLSPLVSLAYFNVSDPYVDIDYRLIKEFYYSFVMDNNQDAVYRLTSGKK